MNNMKNLFFTLCTAFVFAACTPTATPPEPYGAIPSEKQLIWHQLEYYMFIHFGPNTFTNVEWGDGKEDPKVFNPTNLDCRQWAEIAKNAGMKGIIITAKHHDGFCLWPSNYSTHTVRESPWKEGKGDILKELSEACKEFGLKFGVYLSPWDQNHPTYGTPEYNETFAKTLTEVLSNYGEVFEQWFDGANGDAHKGLAQVYDWNLFNETVNSLQPQAVIFSDVGPGCRWIGNERGFAGETNWSTLNASGFEPGLKAPNRNSLNEGNKNGEAWIPGEADVSIRPGWFYSPETDDKVKTLDELMNIYLSSVGRNANLLLNVPPNREGRIHPNDSTRLMELRKALDKAFEKNLLIGGKVKASDTRSKAYTADNLLNKDYNSYWTVDESILTPSLEFTLTDSQTLNCIVIQEYIPLGQRIAKFSVEAWNDETKAWEQLASATTIGYKRIIQFPEVTTNKIRLNIEEALACPILNNVELYKI